METSPVHLLEKYQANYHMKLLLFKMCQLRIEAAWGKAICAVCRKHHAVVYYHHGDKSDVSTPNRSSLGLSYLRSLQETSRCCLLPPWRQVRLAGAVIETQTRHGTACLSLGHASTGSRHALPIPAPRPRIPALCDCRCCKGEGNPIRRNFPILRGYIAGSSALYFEDILDGYGWIVRSRFQSRSTRKNLGH
ncbi:hypothetical protein J6590_099722 [Homalodisca vitripennis]|nr:hypothetical protein J6590_099722 [Homalodisca vitripennis]